MTTHGRWMAVLAVLVSSQALAATPMEGVRIEPRRGFFVETDVGVFFTLGGSNDYSNAQTFLQLGVGYDVSKRLELGAHFALGSSADTCFGTVNAGGFCDQSENFTMSFLGLTAAWRFDLAPRLTLSPKVVGGWTLLDPAPANDAEGQPITGRPHVGGGASLEYATSMDHFSVGADILVRLVVGPNIPAFSIFPRVKYTF